MQNWEDLLAEVYLGRGRPSGAGDRQHQDRHAVAWPPMYSLLPHPSQFTVSPLRLSEERIHVVRASPSSH